MNTILTVLKEASFYREGFSIDPLSRARFIPQSGPGLFLTFFCTQL